MNFINLVDLIQVFANEYCNPSSVVLLIGNESVNDIKLLFQFINSEVVVVETKQHQNVETKQQNVDIIVDKVFPFLKESVDIIICLKEFDEPELRRILKPDGKILLKSKIIGSFENYTVNSEHYSVI